MNASATLNPYNRSFNWISIDKIGFCDGFGSLCLFDERYQNTSYWAYTLFLVPWQTAVYLVKVTYVEVMNINYNAIDFINDNLFYYVGITIPYSYWWFTVITIYVGLVYTYFGLTVGAFCAG